MLGVELVLFVGGVLFVVAVLDAISKKPPNA